MSEPDVTPTVGLALSEAIALLRDELLRAIQTGGAGADVRLPVKSMTVELSATATRLADGRAAFMVPVVNIRPGAGESLQPTSEHKVTVVFGAPVDLSEKSVKVEGGIEDWDRP
jgi:Trypsin-co-occurring domain 2